MGAQLYYNFVGTQKLISKFLQGVRSAEELHLNESLTAEWELGSR